MNTSKTFLNNFFTSQRLWAHLKQGLAILVVFFLVGFLRGEVNAQTGDPDIDVRNNYISIANGDDTPSTSDYTDFGSVAVGNSTSGGMFVIYNTGSANLLLTGTPEAVQFTGPHAADFSLSTIYSSTIYPGGDTEFHIVFAPSAPGLRSATVVIPNNDPDENPYTFAIQGTGLAPEMDVRGNHISIANGDDTPSTSDYTDFGSKAVGNSAGGMFMIHNTGSADLLLTGTPKAVQFTGPHAADFYLATIYNETIAPGGNTEFNIRFTPSAPGLRSATVVIPNNDLDENPYTFAIQGTGIAAGDNEPPVITTKPGTIELWPPNHKYETITVAQCVASVSDNYATLSVDDVVITQVTSDEPEDAKGGGDGNTKKDIVIASDYRSVQLRRERDGSGNGRVYTLHFAVDDGAGNIGRATYLVTVPKSQNGAPAVDDGPVYIVNSGCGILPKSVSYQDDAEEATLPDGYSLEQNYPNPFNPETQIRFAIPEAGAVTLQIFNSAGQLVRTLVSDNMAAGFHQVTWNATDDFGRRVASGLYIYMLRAGAFTAQHKLVLMK